MSRTPDNDRSNPISRAFSKILERGDVRKTGVDARKAQQNAPASTAPAQPRPTPAAGPLAGSAPLPGAQAPQSTQPASTPSPAPAAPVAATPRTVTVAKGDSLSKIAQREYGRADEWKRIFEANRDKISNPDLIQPGQVLTLPPPRSLH